MMLEEYIKKRHFNRTPEPLPETLNEGDALTFVIQKHAASRLHYDLRLEVDGVLKSWAVPGGPSLDPSVKRLAVMVEDHPLEYGSFEGVIPRGEYGAGQVIIWDKGIYLPEEKDHPYQGDKSHAQDLMRNGLQNGKVSIFLYGNKLKGSWALVKMQRTKNDWLLIKHQDESASSDDILTRDASVVSKLTVQDLKNGRSPDRAELIDLNKIPGSQQAEFPNSIRPMFASLADKPFSDPRWIFEPKLDGFRIIALIQNGKATLISRNGLDVSGKYMNLVKELNNLPAKETILDGELVAIDETGQPCFQCLQDYANPRLSGTGGTVAFSAVYYAFDILYLDGYDLRKVPLNQRKELLKKIWLPSKHIRLIDYYENDGISLFKAAQKNGLEGVIGKLRDSVYESGRRSQSWLKIKAVKSDEFVIGGYTKGTGNRDSTFGSLLLGSYNHKGQLIFRGHVGSGFDQKTLDELYRRLNLIKTDECPFQTSPPAEGMVTWLKPDLVAEVKYSEITREGYLRAPVFLRLRDDKSPMEVVLNHTSQSSITNPKATDPPPEKHNWTEIQAKIKDHRKDSLDLEIEGHKISLSNLDKPIWPPVNNSPALTKRDLLLYLVGASSYLLPHLKDRPLTLTRYPNGIGGEHFYQKHIVEALPRFVQTAPLTEAVSGKKNYLLCNNLATLIWLGQLANVDIHTWFSSVTPGPIPPPSGKLAKTSPDFYSRYPDFLVFDIDPYIYSGSEPAGTEPELNPPAFEKTSEAALWLKETLDSLGLNSFIKTSGKTGLHIYVPLIRQLDFGETHAAAKTIAGFVLQKHPRDVTIDWAVSRRKGKIFLDYNQNVRGKTLASAYSPRPTPQATVSTPLLWKELGKVYPTDFTIVNMNDRLADQGDIWGDILNKRSNLAKILDLKIDERNNQISKVK